MCAPGYVHEDPAVTSVTVGCILQNGSSSPTWEVDPPLCYGLPCPNMTFPDDVRLTVTSNVTSNVTSGLQWISDGRVGETYALSCVEDKVFPDASLEYIVTCVWKGNGTGWDREVPSCRERKPADILNITALTSPSAIEDALNSTLGSLSLDSSNQTANNEELKELRDVLMTSLSTVLDTVSDEAGLVSVANLMSIVTNTTADQLSERAMDQAANMSSALLQKVTSANFSTTAVTSLMTYVAVSLGNILNISLSAPDSTSNGTNRIIEQIVRDEKLVELINSLVDVIISVLVESSGIDRVLIEASYVALAVQKIQPGSISASSFNLSTTLATMRIQGDLQLGEVTYAKAYM
ncbi:uncharacterized protein LOC106153783 [Lingula anatina]|uniref:Uncharacterized protein LOC106153783 n=1 Tax=Lingula anatina TaxID=7574 RepID=A0A1S3HBC2_LINAN|nr:uncharacterized protein LOC106153783 [Lingula anatina]|eukprot:XP_013383337.1 uncharacterized protein LOC106153783 [Lingula anatina]